MTDNDQNGEKRIPNASDEIRRARLSASRDRKSSAEAQQLSSGKSAEQLEREADEAEAKRTEKFRDHFELIAVATLYAVWGVVMLIGAVWIYHLIAPPSWHRLPDEQVAHIQSIVNGGIIVGLAGGHIRKRLNQ